MKMMIVATMLMLSALAAPAQAQDGWRDAQGQAIPDTAAHKTERGFSGAVVVTSDRDWKQKWDIPAVVLPDFTEAHEVGPGGELHMLVFFRNPKLNAKRKADVRCDIQVQRPDGTMSADEKNLICFQGALPGSSSDIYLSAPVIKFVGEPGDPPGVWTMKVTLRDTNRRVTMMLETSFTLVE